MANSNRLAIDRSGSLQEGIWTTDSLEPDGQDHSVLCVSYTMPNPHL